MTIWKAWQWLKKKYFWAEKKSGAIEVAEFKFLGLEMKFDENSKNSLILDFES